MANQLAKEKSPYLLQHANNPVDWFAWGKEAFRKAKQENKLIFLSIGYSACHWCHVMEKESFEDPEVAGLLNRDFVSIKVDREERPDIDRIYMTAVQALAGSGGWPLSVFLTPEGKPFTGGTYFPPEDRGGRPGMKTILPRLVHLWKDKQAEVENTGAELTRILDARAATAEGSVDESLLHKAFQQFEANFDPQHGGFGGAPKFPRSHELSFLLSYGFRTKKSQAYAMVKSTLDAMARGGVYDHVGGGFHRYSTDEKWLVPHFEKMLYDQALLAKTYLEGYQVTKNPFFAGAAKDTFNYVLRDMTHPEGGFYSAEDADSEGEEGKFYVWRPKEIDETLGKGAALFKEFYGVSEEGNFEHATSVLHTPLSVEAFAEKKGADLSRLLKILNEGKEKLFEARKKRIPPYKDDKILTAWNGLMISALAYGARVLNEPRYLDAAKRSAGFLLKNLVKDNRLLRRFREGEAAVFGFQDDYSFFVAGLIDLYESTFEVEWLEEAKRRMDQMIELFWDDASGGFFYTANDAEPLILRQKEYYDGAVPSGNSAACLSLVRLSHMLGDSSLEQRAQRTFRSNPQIQEFPMGFPSMFRAFDFALGPTREIVLAGKKGSKDFDAAARFIREGFHPRQVVLYHPEGEEAGRIEKLAAFLKGQDSKDGKVTAYVCHNHRCESPATDLTQLRKLLAET